MSLKLFASLVLLGLTTGNALSAPRPIVVELFTSQACSDCPPADALLKRVQEENADILALDLHVTYWNSVSWNDPYALQSATNMQNYYALLRGSSEIYTPEAVVDGQTQFVGSDRDMMSTAITQARARISADNVVPISINTRGGSLSIHVGAGQDKGAVWLFGFDPKHNTLVLGGENGGATLSEVNVVRSITKLGAWNGRPMILNVRLPAGKKFAVLVQEPGGAIVAATSN